MSGDAPVHLHLLRTEPVDVEPAPAPTEPPGPELDPEPAPDRHAPPVAWETPRAPSPRPDRQDAENEIVGFVCDLVAAPPTAVGTVATSLFEAAFLVVRGARDARPEVERPTLVLPSSAHPGYV